MTALRSLQQAEISGWDRNGAAPVCVQAARPVLVSPSPRKHRHPHTFLKENT